MTAIVRSQRVQPPTTVECREINGDTLETMHLQLVRLSQSRLGQPLADVLALIALQLQHLAVLGMLDHGAIACKFLCK